MRSKYAHVIGKIAQKDRRVVFLTGDLGFNAFEQLRNNLKERFINAGVAEHNMITAASVLAYSGFKPWIYSIAPFVTIKVLEEIRNDVCEVLSNVKIVGLGGGYDYGIAGPTHHALEDIGVLLTIPHMRVYAPAFSDDVETVVKKMHRINSPAYLRLTKAENHNYSIPPYAACRHMASGNKITMVVLGSIAHKVMCAYNALRKNYQQAIDLWIISELPLSLSKKLTTSLRKTRKICVVEEHVKNGGLGQQLSLLLVENNIPVDHFVHLYARGHLSKKYGDRNFYLKETGLDEENISKTIKKLYGQS